MRSRRQRPVSARVRILLAAGALVWLLSCQSATRVGDRYYEKGRYPEAAAAFQIYLDSSPADEKAVARSLFRIGVIFAMPNSPTYDPPRSIEALERLMSNYPSSPYRTAAGLLRDLQLEIAHLDREVSSIQNRVQAVEADLADRGSRTQILEEQLAGREQEIAALEDSIPPLRAEIRALKQELAAKQLELEQLEQLKAIDLAEPPQQP